MHALGDHSTRWVVVAVVALLVSFALRVLAHLGTQRGEQRLARARRELGQAPPPVGTASTPSAGPCAPSSGQPPLA